MPAAGKHADIPHGSCRVLSEGSSLAGPHSCSFCSSIDSPSATSESTSIFTFSPSSLDS